MISLRHSLLTASLCAVFALTGCSGLATSGGEEAAVENSYQTFLEEAPSFDPAVTNVPFADTVFASIANLSKMEYEDLKEIDAITSKHMKGYEVQAALEKLRADESQKGKDAEYLASLSKEEKKAHEDYLAAAGHISDRANARYEEITKAVAAVYAIKKTDLAKHLNPMQLLSAGGALADAASQAKYAMDAAEWFRVFDAQLKNAQADQGR